MSDVERRVYCTSCEIDLGLVHLPAEALKDGLYRDYWSLTKNNHELEVHHTAGRCSIYSIYKPDLSGIPLALVMYEGTYVVNTSKDPVDLLTHF